MPRPVLDLDRTLSYQNNELVLRFMEDHGVSREEAQELFLETKRWLWLCAKRNQDAQTGAQEYTALPLFSEAFAIDLFWHTFLLFTKDYDAFCRQEFGFFIHHLPTPHQEKKDFQDWLARDPAAAKAGRRAVLAKAYGYIYDQLGPETLLLWCESFPQKYNKLLKNK